MIMARLLGIDLRRVRVASHYRDYYPSGEEMGLARNPKGTEILDY